MIYVIAIRAQFLVEKFTTNVHQKIGKKTGKKLENIEER
jgi:hypothetical protein